MNPKNRPSSIFGCLVASIIGAASLVPLLLGAQELTPEEEMARKAQDPLGDVRALMTDNTIAFGAGENEGDTTFGFQLQPVYAIPNKSNWNMIARVGVVVLPG